MNVWRVESLDGQPATEQQMKSVLSSLTSLLIRGEYRDGNETGDIDNIILNGNPTAVDEDHFNTIKRYRLSQNFPNPFNPITMITYQLPMSNNVNLSIYNPVGQKVATLVDKRQKAGYHQVEWDASGFASGVYYYRLTTNSGFVQTRKLVIIR
jgi:hypothetical protein